MKKITYSFLSLLMLLLAMPASMLARTTVTFDFAANPWGLPLSSSASGEADKGAITSPILQDGVTLTTTDGTTKTKMWVTNDAIDFRVYKSGGSFTFTAPKGKVIEKIEFAGTVAATADAGTYDGSSRTWVQPKEQVNAVKFTATNTNKIKKAILTIADPGEGAEVVVLPEIADFASLKAAEQDKAVKLTVTNGKVVYAGSKDLIVEDATGAIDFYNWGLTATAGQVINGTVEAKYSEFMGMPQAAKTANTDVAALTITDGDAVAPVAMEFADAMKATSYLKYVTLTDFTIEEADGNTYLVSGENKIQLYDKFKVEYTLPKDIQSISGIIIPFVAKGSTDVIVEIAPTSAEDIVAKPEGPAYPEAGTYYIKNVATGKFMAAGSSWGSHAIVDDHGFDVKLATLEEGKYTIDTQISNGGVKNFLNGEFTDGASFTWTFVATTATDGTPAFYINNGEKNLSAQEGNQDVVLQTTDNDYAKWVFVTEAERIAALANATAEAGMDATWLIKGHNIGRNDTRNNTWQGSVKPGGDVTNMNAEKYNTDFDVSQTIKVPNGKYVLELQGFYRNGEIKISAPAHLNGSENLYAKAYANTVETSLPSVYADAGKVDAGSSVEGIEGKFPNSQADASKFFSAGAYNLALDPVVVSDGTLKIGVKKVEKVAADWACFDNFRLTYYGEVTDVAVFKEAYEAALAAAKAAVSDDTYAEVAGDERTALTAAIDANSTVAEETKDAYVAATTALNEATNTFKGAKDAYVALATAKAQYKDFDVAAYKYASEEKATALADALLATAKNAEEATAKASALVAAVRSIVESNALAEGVEGATNYTESIKNPNAEALDGWTTALGEINKGNIKVLNNEPFTDAEGNSTHSYFDGGSWGDKAWDVTFSQDVTLPKGKYLLTATSRASADLTSFALFAGEARAEMKHVGASGELFDRGWNDNSVEFEVAEDDATVNLGVQGVTDKQHQWMSFTRFRLVKVGEVAPSILEINNLADLRKIEVEDEWAEVPVKVNLHDAKITALHKSSDYGMDMIDFAILEDATGAIAISALLNEATATGLLEDNFTVGAVLNGSLYALYSWPNSLSVLEGMTEKSDYKVTPSTLEVPEAKLGDILKYENDLRVFELKDVTIKNVGNEEYPEYNLYQDGRAVMLSDALQLFPIGQAIPEKLESITGILYGLAEELGQEVTDYMFVPTSYKSTPVVENIAGLSKIEGGEMEDPSVKLMLKNAKITYVQNMDEGIDPRATVAFAILEDETGAVEISNIITKANANSWFDGELKEGVELNGYINVNYSAWSTALVANDETSKSVLTITPTTITPTEAKIADLQKAENHLRLFELKDVDFAVEDGAPVIKQDDASIILADQFSVLPEDMPETAKFESIEGVVFLDFESYVFCPISYTLAEAKPIEVNSIADLNKLGEENEGATIKLKLTDAQITVADAYMNSAIIEDKTGAFNAQYFFAEAVGMEMLKDEFKQGVVLNGYLYATYSYGSIEVCDLTAESNITTTEAPVVATEADFAEVLKAENNFRLYEFKNITVNKNEDDKFQLVKGDAKAEISDRTHSLEESMMATVESVVGYFRVVGDDAEFTLLSYKTSTSDGISALEVAAKNAAVYNMNGAKVRNAGESVKGLAKGIYVVGGKKIVVK